MLPNDIIIALSRNKDTQLLFYADLYSSPQTSVESESRVVWLESESRVTKVESESESRVMKVESECESRVTKVESESESKSHNKSTEKRQPYT